MRLLRPFPGGFTLTEIVMVILIVAIMAAVGAAKFIDFRSDAKSAITKDGLVALKTAITGNSKLVSGNAYVSPGYESDMGALPTTLTDLVTNPNTGNTTQDYDALARRGWRGPYVDPASSYNADAWGAAYIYSKTARTLRSKGPNGIDDSGAGDDLQITF